MAQTLTTENVMPWTAQSEHVTSFTTDKTILNVVKYFLRGSTIEIKPSEIICPTTTSKKRKFEETDGGNEKFEISDVANSKGSVLKKNNEQDSSVEINKFLQAFASIVYECVIKDKINLLPIWVNVIKSIEIVKTKPNSFMIWQIKLMCSFLLRRNNASEVENPLFRLENALTVHQKLASIMDGWEHGDYNNYFFVLRKINRVILAI